MYSLLTLPLLLPLLVAAQNPAPISIPSAPTDLQLQTTDAEYTAIGFNNPDQKVGFGIDLHSQAVVTAVYQGGVMVQAEGQALTKDQVSALPAIYITPSEKAASNFTSEQAFTVMLADASAVGHPDPQGNFRHYLANSINPGQPASDSNSTLQLSGGQVITSYAGPGPNAGEGPHRYAWLVFQQPQGFAAPQGVSQPGTGPNHWSVQEYVTSSHLGSLVGAAFFTVENGQASYSVAPTSQVDTKTLPAASETGGASGSQSGDGPQETGNSDSAAGSNTVAKGVVAAGAIVAGVAALL